MEKRHIAAVLEHTDGNVTRAAEILKVDRVTVYNKIKKYGLRPNPDHSRSHTSPTRKRGTGGHLPLLAVGLVSDCAQSESGTVNNPG